MKRRQAAKKLQVFFNLLQTLLQVKLRSIMLNRKSRNKLQSPL